MDVYAKFWREEVLPFLFFFFHELNPTFVHSNLCTYCIVGIVTKSPIQSAGFQNNILGFRNFNRKRL